MLALAPQTRGADEDRPRPSPLELKLAARTDIVADKEPLAKFVERLAKQQGVTIRLDEAGLKRARVSPEAPVTASIRNFTLNATLKHVLDELALYYVVEGDAIVVTGLSPAAAAAQKAAAEAERTRAAQRLKEQMPPAPAPARAAAVQVRLLGAGVQPQMAQQLRPLLIAELRFVRAACQPTKEQFHELVQAGDKCLNDVATSFAANQGRRAGPLVAQVGPQAAPVPLPIELDPGRQIRLGLATAVKEGLSEAQVARYVDESEKRAAHRRRVVIQMLVLRLDESLGLSAEQRAIITTSLSEGWQDAWSAWLYLLDTTGNALPAIPRPGVAPHLSASQKQIWERLPTVSLQPEMLWMYEVQSLQLLGNDLALDEEGLP